MADAISESVKGSQKGSAKITLANEIQINGVVVPAGSHDVPAEVAEDWKRIDDEHGKYLASLNVNNPVSGQSSL